MRGTENKKMRADAVAWIEAERGLQILEVADDRPIVEARVADMELLGAPAGGDIAPARESTRPAHPA